MSQRSQQSSILGPILLLCVVLTISYAVLLVLKPSNELAVTKLAKAESQTKSEPIPKPTMHNTIYHGAAMADTEAHTAQHLPDEDGLLAQAAALVNSGKFQEAKKILEDILAKDPTSDKAMVDLGLIYLLDLKDSANAKIYLEKALVTNPNNPTALSELVTLYTDQKQGDAGLNFMQDVYDRSEHNPNVALGIGQLLASKRHFDDAIPYLEESAREGKNPDATTELGDVLSQSGHGDKAIEAYARTIDIEKKRIADGFYSNQPKVGEDRLVMAHMDVIGEYLSQKNWDRANEELAKVREVYNDDERLAALLEQVQARRR